MRTTAVLAMSAVGLAAGHTIVSKPQPRDSQVHTGGNFECGNDKTIKGFYQRGQSVDIEWGSNNHHAGFTQISVQPISVDPNGQKSRFDDPANIIHVSCYNQPTCQAGGGGDDMGLGGDPNAGQFQSNFCKTKFTVPSYLADGDYVMKTSIFGNGDSHGVRNYPHNDYQNCHNFNVRGGVLGAKPGGNQHIEWKLNDYAIDRFNGRKGTRIPQGMCLLMGTNRHNGCVGGAKSTPCTGNVARVSKCGGGQSDSYQECENPNGNKGNGEPLYNYMAGLPDYHPGYDGNFWMLSHAKGSAKLVNVDGGAVGPVGGGGGGGGGGSNPTPRPRNPTPRPGNGGGGGGKTCKTYPGFDQFPGTGFNNMNKPVSARSDGDCARACESTNGCKAWVNQPSNNNCWLSDGFTKMITRKSDRTYGHNCLARNEAGEGGDEGAGGEPEEGELTNGAVNAGPHAALALGMAAVGALLL